ncbi:MAG TPA: hypothetical protein VN451_08550, partial [Chitinophagaceae bacterium]|nr:hypothetical protein [Chitinophagaceae bacterium]
TMKKISVILFITGLFLSNFICAQDIPLKQFDKRGVAVIDSFMTALMNNQADEMAAARAALPFIHRSEYDNTGTTLKQDRIQFSFKKAWQNAKFYKWYVQVTRVQQQKLTGIGFGETAENGISYKVWIAKKDGVGGLPAPLNVFFPADGSDPKLYYYGSL